MTHILHGSMSVDDDALSVRLKGGSLISTEDLHVSVVIYISVVLFSIVLQSHVRFIQCNELSRYMKLTLANCYLSLNIDGHTWSRAPDTGIRGPIHAQPDLGV